MNAIYKHKIDVAATQGPLTIQVMMRNELDVRCIYNGIAYYKHVPDNYTNIYKSLIICIDASVHVWPSEL